MLSILLLVVFMTPGPLVESDTSGTFSVPEEGVIRMTYGAPRMQVVPGIRRGRQERPVQQTSSPAGFSDRDIGALERLINRRFDRLEALSGVGGSGLAAILNLIDTPQGPALLMQHEGRIDAPPDTLLLAHDLTSDQRRFLEAPEQMVERARDLPLADLRQPGDPFVLDRRTVEEGLFPAVRLNFEFDENDLLDYADPVLDSVGDVMVRHPWLRLEVAGHTDNVGSAAYNQALSERRAQAARAYLLNRFDIAPDRLIARGYGLTQPLTANRTETERAVNRRVEFLAIDPFPEAEEATAPDADEARDAIRDAVREAIRESLTERPRTDVEW